MDKMEQNPPPPGFAAPPYTPYPQPPPPLQPQPPPQPSMYTYKQNIGSKLSTNLSGKWHRVFKLVFC